MGCRVTASVGGILLVVGLTGSHFAPSLWSLTVTYGIISGLGLFNNINRLKKNFKDWKIFYTFKIINFQNNNCKVVKFKSFSLAKTPHQILKTNYKPIQYIFIIKYWRHVFFIVKGTNHLWHYMYENINYLQKQIFHS